jgi:geranyl-CoA carboxylase alpha subunit
MHNFNSVLVANRGEIALRVMHTARKLGLRTVAVYSEADMDAPHRHFADAAVAIGGAAAADSYLQGARIIDAALSSGALAIHPGYGLLSENAAFARAVVDAGLIFVGPPADAIEVMADKARAKVKMRAAGVPCVPGYDGEDQGIEQFISEAEALGTPLMLKAAAGGGGRGMRLVSDLAELPHTFDAARSEAQAAFGDGTLLMERAVSNGKHVEIQVFADAYGNAVYLGERDCSIQRRHQKVVEEAPCPVLTPTLRDAMGQAAVDAARAVAYLGAGTVEFLLDEDQQFYFLEMNTRLQVEHPVTELITGLDLVEWQFRVADGEVLPLVQSKIEPRGHAIEVRLCAESPEREFLPDTGPIALWRTPAGAVEFDVARTLSNGGVRIDAGIVNGGEVSPYYDSMVAKVMAYGRDRDEARQRLVRALEETALIGPACNRDFLLSILAHATFVDGSFTTAFINDHFGNYGARALEPEELALGAALLWKLRQRRALERSVGVNPELLGWSSMGALVSAFDFGSAEMASLVDIESMPTGVLRVSALEHTFDMQVVNLEASRATVLVGHKRYNVNFSRDRNDVLSIATSSRIYTVKDIACRDKAAADANKSSQVRAPMHGRVLEVLVQPGQVVLKGARLAVLEAMKMQHDILASVDGTVEAVAVEAGGQIAAQELLVMISENEP